LTISERAARDLREAAKLLRLTPDEMLAWLTPTPYTSPHAVHEQLLRRRR